MPYTLPLNHQPLLDLLTPVQSVRYDDDDDDDDIVNVQLLLVLFFKVLLPVLVLLDRAMVSVVTARTWHGSRTSRFSGTARLRLLLPAALTGAAVVTVAPADKRPSLSVTFSLSSAPVSPAPSTLRMSVVTVAPFAQRLSAVCSFTGVEQANDDDENVHCSMMFALRPNPPAATEAGGGCGNRC